MNGNVKKILIWFGKLAILTVSIYWFMTKGLTISIDESVGLETPSTTGLPLDGGSGINAFIYAGILIAFLAFAIGRSIYERCVSKPKSETYGRFRDMR